MRKTSPFSPAFGNRPSHLVGREGIIQVFMDGLAQEPGSRDRAILLLGQRGSGKTVLLWELADRARERGFVVANPTTVTEGMLDRIIEKIQDDGERFIAKHGVRVSGGSIGALGFSIGLQFSKDIQETKSFQYKLTHLCRALAEQGRGVLVLIDEVRANNPEIRQLVAAYQELIGEQANIAMVMAGLPGSVSATLNDHVLTFLNRARKIVLEPLPVREVDAYFATTFDQLGLQVSDARREALAKATQGSPYMLQLVGYNTVRYAPENGEVDDETVRRAITASASDFENDVCETTIASLSDRDVAFLAAMTADETESRLADIAERMEVTPDYAQKYRKRLIDAGVIRSVRRGYVAFAVPYLLDYLKQRR